ncbi:MAG: DUF1735 domain-containing protein [Ferruginibacter sp.]
MKINIKTSLAAILLLSMLSGLSCKKKTVFGAETVFGEDKILITGTESYPIVKFSVENTPAQYLVTATATKKVIADTKVTFALDTAAVTKFNKEHNTTYFTVPVAAVDLSGLETTIKAASSASTPAIVKMVSTSSLIDGRSYLIPISITTVTGGDIGVLESSRTIFLRVARVIGFPALSMNNSNAGTTGTPGTPWPF